MLHLEPKFLYSICSALGSVTEPAKEKALYTGKKCCNIALSEWRTNERKILVNSKDNLLKMIKFSKKNPMATGM